MRIAVPLWRSFLAYVVSLSMIAGSGKPRVAGALLAPVCFALSLFSAEAGLATGAYLLAYTLSLEAKDGQISHCWFNSLRTYLLSLGISLFPTGLWRRRRPCLYRSPERAVQLSYLLLLSAHRSIFLVNGPCRHYLSTHFCLL